MKNSCHKKIITVRHELIITSWLTGLEQVKIFSIVSNSSSLQWKRKNRNFIYFASNYRSVPDLPNPWSCNPLFFAAALVSSIWPFDFGTKLEREIPKEPISERAPRARKRQGTELGWRHFPVLPVDMQWTLFCKVKMNCPIFLTFFLLL